MNTEDENPPNHKDAKEDAEEPHSFYGVIMGVKSLNLIHRYCQNCNQKCTQNAFVKSSLASSNQIICGSAFFCENSKCKERSIVAGSFMLQLVISTNTNLLSAIAFDGVTANLIGKVKSLLTSFIFTFTNHNE